MAILSKIVIAASALAALTAARPLAIRDVTSTVTETAYTTIDVPVTVWVDEEGKPLSTVAQGGNFVASTSVAPSSTSIAESPKVIQSSASPSTPHIAQVVPTTTAAPQAQAYTPAPSPSPSPSTSTSTSVPAAVPTNSAQSGQISGEVVASSSGTCEGSGDACSGDITHWDGGLGACGWNVDSNSEMQIALPAGFMGTQSNGNPYCGRSLTIRNPTTGQTTQATVGDKCMGCQGRSIDLTNALFAAIGGGCDGRCGGFQWWFD